MYMEMIRVDDQTITGNEHSNPDLVTMHKITRHHLRQVNRKRFNNNTIVSKLPRAEIQFPLYIQNSHVKRDASI